MDEALRLLDSPEKWTTGTWKCEIYELNKKTGLREPRTDKKGRQVYAYCIEGAVNQAVINKFGPIRAKELGALRPEAPNKVESEYLSQQIDCGGACNLISVNDIAVELYADEWEILRHLDDNNARAAQYVNDAQSGDEEDAPEYGYYDVIRILTTRRQRVADAIRQKFHDAA